MSAIQVIPWEQYVPDDRCMALWREELPCPNISVWRVQNTLNAGYSHMCELHAQEFQRAYPTASVLYFPLG
jgi:hypothetical protein